MRLAILILTVFGFLTTSATAAKEPKLSDTLVIKDVQGGFAGFTGWQYTFKPDGSWTREQVFNRRLTPKGKGKLTGKKWQSLLKAVAVAKIAKLPATIGKPIGANPHVVTLTYGKKTVNVTAQPGAQLPTKPTTPAGRVGQLVAAAKAATAANGK